MNEVMACKLLRLLNEYYKDCDDNLALVDAPSILAVGSLEWITYMFYS